MGPLTEQAGEDWLFYKVVSQDVCLVASDGVESVRYILRAGLTLFGPSCIGLARIPSIVQLLFQLRRDYFHQCNILLEIIQCTNPASI